MEIEIVAKDVHEIKNTLTKFGMKLELVYNALIGNEILKDGGLVADLLIQKSEIRALTQRVNVLEGREDKRQVYIRITWGVVGALLTALVAAIMNYLGK